MLVLVAGFLRKTCSERVLKAPLWVCLCAILFINGLSAAPMARNRYYDNESSQALKEMRDSIEDMRHEVNNHETEIRSFDEKLSNLDNIIESVRDQMAESNKSHKEQLKGNSTSMESKITALETSNKSLINDLKQFKTHANETAAALAQYKLKISQLESIIEQQNQNLDHLQLAMRSLMDALQVRESVPERTSTVDRGASKSDVATVNPAPAGSYRVKAGDTLEKIARAQQVSIQALKELNGLTNDRIVVGKLLKIPEK